MVDRKDLDDEYEREKIREKARNDAKSESEANKKRKQFYPRLLQWFLIIAGMLFLFFTLKSFIG